MSTSGEQASTKAREFAEKKKAALQRANDMRRQREQDSALVSMTGSAAAAAPRSSFDVMTSFPGEKSVSAFRFEDKSSSSGTTVIIQELRHPVSKAPIAERIVIKENFAENRRQPAAAGSHQVPRLKSYNNPSLRDHAEGRELPPVGGRHRSLADGRATGEAKDLRDYSSNGGEAPASSSGGSSYLRPPIDPAGALIDLSDRPLVCCSLNHDGSEAVFGGADHALYAVDIGAGARSAGAGSGTSRYGAGTSSSSSSGYRVKKMYNKTCGHKDWVSSVAHLPWGAVVSAGMDQQLLLWNSSKTQAAPLMHHSSSISKVVAPAADHPLAGSAFSCGYDKTIAIWSCSSSAARAPRGGQGPSLVISGEHRSPVVELLCVGGAPLLMSGGRDGAVIINECSASGAAKLGAFIGHKGTVTCLNATHASSLLSGGIDGYITAYDIRSGSKRSSVVSAGLSLTCMARPVGDTPYVFSGSADGCVRLLDSRKGYEAVSQLSGCCRNGAYVLCAVGGTGVLAGDGAGGVIAMDLGASAGAIYGLGASASGAVRTLHSASSKSLLIAGCEDGKAIVYAYS